MLQKVPEPLGDATTTTTLPNGTSISAADGLHQLLDAGRKQRMQILQSDPNDTALAAIIPLDRDGFARLEAVYQLLARLHGRAVPGDSRLTCQKRRRARRMLQAHDGRIEGASQREIAEAIFQMPRVSRDEWQSASERFAVMALLRDARKMIDGGYLTLLRPKKLA